MLAEELAQSFTYWRERLTSRLAGLGDEEYLWEPVEGCWTVRPAAAGRWAADLGPSGTPATDTDPPPVTTIAWRMWHLGAGPVPYCMSVSAPTPRAFADQWFSPPPPDFASAMGAARDAVATLDDHWRTFVDAVGHYADGELLEPIGPIGGPFSQSSIHGLLVHVADELIHHSAEIALLRDLYRAGYAK